jgi:hypothetical protein
LLLLLPHGIALHVLRASTRVLQARPLALIVMLESMLRMRPQAVVLTVMQGSGRMFPTFNVLTVKKENTAAMWPQSVPIVLQVLLLPLLDLRVALLAQLAILLQLRAYQTVPLVHRASTKVPLVSLYALFAKKESSLRAMVALPVALLAPLVTFLWSLEVTIALHVRRANTRVPQASLLALIARQEGMRPMRPRVVVLTVMVESTLIFPLQIAQIAIVESIAVTWPRSVRSV